MSWVARAELIFSSDNLSLQLERIPETLPIPTFDLRVGWCIFNLKNLVRLLERCRIVQTRTLSCNLIANRTQRL